MRVDLVQNYPIARRGIGRGYHSNGVNSSNQVQSMTRSNFVQLTFTGKNMWQVASITPENSGLGLPEASQGGEGVVGYELPTSLRKHEKVNVKMPNGEKVEKNVDARSFMTFWEYNNPKGGYKFLIHKGIPSSELNATKANDTMPAKYFYSAELGEDIESVEKRIM